MAEEGRIVRTMEKSNREKIKVGVSTCLLGEYVRWDGNHKRDRYVTDVLNSYFQWEAVCPEVEVGMGIPREPVRLEGGPRKQRMIGRKSRTDWTEKMKSYTAKRLRQLQKSDLCGYILQKRSPSCGMGGVPIYGKGGQAGVHGPGLFAKALMEKFPWLPVEEEGRLNDHKLRDNFIVRVFSYARLKRCMKDFSPGKLIAFHSQHKYLLLAHSPKHYNEMGRLVANVKKLDTRKFQETYCTLFMEALKTKTTVRKNVNVLQHMLGFFKTHIDREDKTDLVQAIEDYRGELVPLIVPITLIAHYVKKYRVQYLLDQVYLNPHPKELMLRNHV